jgi:hypothetical protein
MSEATRRGCSGLLASGGLALGAILLKEVLVPDALRLGLHEAGLSLAPAAVGPEARPPAPPLAAPRPPAPAASVGEPPAEDADGYVDLDEAPIHARPAQPAPQPPSAAPAAPRTPGPKVAGLEVNPLDAAARGWALQAEALRGLSCGRLALVRQWVYARHGYSFPDARSRRVFRSEPGYRADPAVGPDTIEGRLSEADRANRGLLLSLELKQGC